jgi:hypothetical protein
MTKFYKISPKFKKSIYEYQTFKDEEKGVSCVTEDMYRWGHCILKVENDEELQDIIGDKDDAYNEFEFDHTMTEDQEVDDQCSFYFNDVKGMSIEELEEKYEEDGHDYILDTFGEPHEFYTVYHGELNVEDVTEEWSKK